MNFNLTLIAQAVTFALFIWFTVKFVWPPLLKAIEERQARIAEGLQAAEQGKQALERSVYHVLLGDASVEEARQPAKEGGYHVLPANRDLGGAEFRWVDASQIVTRTTPDAAVVVERREWGNAYGLLAETGADGALVLDLAGGTRKEIPAAAIVRV